MRGSWPVPAAMMARIAAASISLFSPMFSPTFY